MVKLNSPTLAHRHTFMATSAPPNLPSGTLSAPSPPLRRRKPPPTLLPLRRPISYQIAYSVRGGVRRKAAEVSEMAAEVAQNWVPVVPLTALPKGERRVIVQDGETILLLWYKDDVYAIENRSPAEGAYSEGLLNAKLTQDGCIVCPTTDSTFDLRSGEIKDWYPNNPVLRALTPPLRTLFVYPVKTDDANVYIDMGEAASSDASSEIIFSGRAQPGVTATDVNVEEVKMVIDEGSEAFGFTGRNELINGKVAIIGFLFLLDFELLTGKGLLKGTENVKVSPRRSHQVDELSRKGLSGPMREVLLPVWLPPNSIWNVQLRAFGANTLYRRNMPCQLGYFTYLFP